MPVDLDRVAKLVQALEKDLAGAKADDATIRKLLAEIDAIKSALKSPAPGHEGVRDNLHSMRDTMERAAGTVTGELWRDAPYLAELGRILGLG
jgi:hypothetical protein